LVLVERAGMEMDEVADARDELRLYVCVTCRRSDLPEGETRPGEQLHRALSVAIRAEALSLPHVTINPVECLSGCKRACTIALAGPGRWTYVYGDLDPETSVAPVLDGLRRYGATPDGLVPWRDRPSIFRKGVLARIPPFPLLDEI
jgi:predicted metal-binding protein